MWSGHKLEEFKSTPTFARNLRNEIVTIVDSFCLRKPDIEVKKVINKKVKQMLNTIYFVEKQVFRMYIIHLLS